MESIWGGPSALLERATESLCKLNPDDSVVIQRTEKECFEEYFTYGVRFLLQRVVDVEEIVFEKHLELRVSQGVHVVQEINGGRDRIS